MNWIVFTIALWFVAGLEAGFSGALQLGSNAIVPSFLMVLLVYVSLRAREADAIIAVLVIGLLLDLLNQIPTENSEHVVVLGPHALASMVAFRAIQGLRGLMFRQSVITLASLTLIAALLIHMAVLLLLSIRASYDSLMLGPIGADLVQRASSSFYTALIAIPFGWILQRLVTPLMGFRQPHQLAPVSRRA